ncbi:S-layer homology domain-containing protein [Oscillospiraceae bacterium WX1]
MKKNLRKVLAVVLVVCIAMSFVTIASAKSFTDDTSIKYTEAVSVVSGIGAINGYTDGSFGPTKSITRAEAAKMIAYTVLGPTVAGALPAATSSFSDVKSTDWASKYIEYCVQNGIINGIGNGKFNPDGNVTGIELAKMLLTAVGYGKDNEYTGANWAFTVIQDAFNNGIFNGNESGNYAVAATREEAALYIFNVLMNTVKVTYSKVTDTYTNVAGNKTIAMATYGMVTPIVGVITANAATGATGTKVATATVAGGKITDIADVAGVPTTTTYTYTTALNQVGQVVKVYYKDASTVYSMVPVSTAVTVSTAIAASATNYAAAFGTATASASTGVMNATANIAAVTVDAAIAGAFNGTTAASTGTYQVYGGEVVSYVAPSVSTLDKVDDIVTAAGVTTYSFNTLADKVSTLIVNTAGVVKGDIVKVTQAGTMYTLEKTSTVVGKITEVGAANSYVVVNGTKYTLSTSANGTGLAIATNYTDNYTIYLDSAGTYFASVVVTPAAATSNVVYLTGVSYPVTGAYGAVTMAIQAVDSTGKEVIYNTGAALDPQIDDEVVNAALDGDAISEVIAGFYKVTVNTTTGVADFAAYATPGDFVAVSAVGVATGTEVRNGTNYYYDANVKFIFVSGSGATLKIETVTGVAASKDNNLTNALVYFNNTTAVNKVISTVIVPAAYTAPASSGSTAPVIYIPLGTVMTGSNANGNVFSVYIDGVKTTITAVDSNANIAAVDDGFATYTLTNGVYDFTGVNGAANLTLNVAVANNGIYNSFINAINAAGATVIDLVNATPVYTSVAAMEAATATKAFTIDTVADSTGKIITIYITGIA